MELKRMEIKEIERAFPEVFGVNVEWYDGSSSGKGGFATMDIAYAWAMTAICDRRIRENKNFVPKSVTITSSLR